MVYQGRRFCGGKMGMFKYFVLCVWDMFWDCLKCFINKARYTARQSQTVGQGLVMQKKTLEIQKYLSLTYRRTDRHGKVLSRVSAIKTLRHWKKKDAETRKKLSVCVLYSLVWRLTCTSKRLFYLWRKDEPKDKATLSKSRVHTIAPLLRISERNKWREVLIVKLFWHDFSPFLSYSLLAPACPHCPSKYHG